MANMDVSKGKWENRILTVCTKCAQNLRVPISYKPLQVTCPRCKNEFLYNYLMEFGNEGEYSAKLQIQSILLIISLTIIYLLGFFVCLALQNYPGVIICVLAGILIVTTLLDYKTFIKYLPIKLLVINRQGLIFFDGDARAKECLNWNDIKSAKYLYSRHMFAGLIETKREPACVELEMNGRGKVVVPPAMFFNDKQRIEIIDGILKHYGSNRFFYGT